MLETEAGLSSLRGPVLGGGAAAAPPPHRSRPARLGFPAAAPVPSVPAEPRSGSGLGPRARREQQPPRPGGKAAPGAGERGRTRLAAPGFPPCSRDKKSQLGARKGRGNSGFFWSGNSARCFIALALPRCLPTFLGGGSGAGGPCPGMTAAAPGAGLAAADPRLGAPARPPPPPAPAPAPAALRRERRPVPSRPAARARPSLRAWSACAARRGRGRGCRCQQGKPERSEKPPFWLQTERFAGKYRVLTCCQPSTRHWHGFPRLMGSQSHRTWESTWPAMPQTCNTSSVP